MLLLVKILVPSNTLLTYSPGKLCLMTIYTTFLESVHLTPLRQGDVLRITVDQEEGHPANIWNKGKEGLILVESVVNN